MSEKNVQTEKAKKDLKSGAGLGQLTVTLCAICAVCALALGLTNMITAPIIEKNIENKKAAAIAEKVLPGFTGTLTEMYYIGTDKTVKSVQKGSDGSYVVEVSPRSSYSGNLTLLIGINPDKTIAGLSVTASSETEGIGANALTDEYFAAQYVGKTGPVELTKNGGDVEGVTGATYTSTGVKDAVNSAYEALDYLSDDASQVPEPPSEPEISENIVAMAQEGDGYVAIVDCGFDSYNKEKTLVLKITMDANKTVTGIEVMESGETQGIGSNALTEDYLQNYYGKTAPVEVDAYAGASFTSGAVKNAVNAALEAIDYPNQWPTTPVWSVETTPEPTDEPEGPSVAQEGDGYVVTVDCPGSFSGTLKIEVRLDADKKVTGITVVESSETEGIGSKALTEDYLKQYYGQTAPLEVEVCTGATFTSTAVKNGVNAALKAVGVEVPDEPEESGAPEEPTESTGPEETAPPATSTEEAAYTVTVDCGADSFSGTLKLEVRFDANKKVIGITVVESGETQGIGSNALTADYFQKFYGKSNADGVDTVASATFTSTAVKNGVNAAVRQIGGQASSGTPAPTPTPTPEPTPTPAPAENNSASGSEGYTVVVDCGADSFSGTLKLEVRLDANYAVTGITVVESGETDGIGSNALTADYLQKFYGKSSADGVDTVTDATFTSTAVKNGINAAIRTAKSQG